MNPVDDAIIGIMLQLRQLDRKIENLRRRSDLQNKELVISFLENWRDEEIVEISRLMSLIPGPVN
jgi:hypothetical protein